MSTGRLRVGVAGAGHFGRFHALKLAASPRAALAGVHDHAPDRAARVAAEAGAPALDLTGLLASCDALIVAVPAAAHHAIAAAALRAGRHVLVEKPIAATLAEADDLAALAGARALVLQVGHLERFSAAHGAVRDRAGAPLHIEASRMGPFKPRGTDVSVVLDLMIHDLDLILELMASPLAGVEAVGNPVASELDDVVTAHLRFASGATARLHASRVAPSVQRRMRIDGAEGQVNVDFVARTLSAGTETISWREHDALEAEQASFIAAVLDGTRVVVDAIAGRRALAAALRVEAAITEGREDKRVQ